MATGASEGHKRRLKSSMEALVSEVKKLAQSTTDDAERKKLLDSLNELQLSIESPFDTIQRIAYSVLTVFSRVPVIC